MFSTEIDEESALSISIVNLNVHQNEKKVYNKITKEKKSNLINAVLNEGFPIKDAARLFNVNYGSAKRIIAEVKRLKLTTELYKNSEEKIISKSGRKTKLTTEIMECMENAVQECPTYTLKSIKEHVSRTKNLEISIPTIHRALEKMMITLKVGSKLIDRVNSESTLILRADYARNFNMNAPIDRNKCIFVDESGFNLHLRPSKARSKKGLRALIPIPTVRGRNTTLIIAANQSQVVDYMIIADSTCNSEKFYAFLTSLTNTISNDPALHSSWIIMDNARIHKPKIMTEIAERRG